MLSLFSKYPLKYTIIWSLILCFIFFSIIIFALIFVHRTAQDNHDKIFKYRLRKIETLLTYLIFESDTNSITILNAYRKSIPQKQQKNNQFKHQLLSTAIALFDKMQGASQQSILQIIDTLQLNKIIYKNINTKNSIKKMIGLNALQVLHLQNENINIKSTNKNIVNKYNELIFENGIMGKNNIIYNDWQKSFILYFLQRNKSNGLPDFSKILITNTNIELKQFAVELIYYFGQFEYTVLLLKMLKDIDFKDIKNNSLISVLITACMYFEESDCRTILNQKLASTNPELKNSINNFLAIHNIA